jgi:signal transduction histidine kinase
MKIFSIRDEFNNVISENLNEKCIDCFNSCNTNGLTIECKLNNEKKRQGKIVTKKGTTFLCDFTKTTKLFRDKLEGLSYAFQDLILPKKQIEDDLRKIEQQKVNRLVHNLTSINAHNIQEIYDLVPQDILSSNWKTQSEYIKKEISRHPDKAAMMFLRIAKHNIHMKSEFSIYRKLDRTDKVSLDIKKWSIRNVLLNVLHTFFADFTNNGVYVQVVDLFLKIPFDYETIQVAFYHLIENASKYTKPNSTINIRFSESPTDLILSMEMISLYIDPSERRKIFSEGFSGKLAKSKGLSGDGIGMWRIKQMMELNGGEIDLICGDKIQHYNKTEYAENIFDLKFKKH